MQLLISRMKTMLELGLPEFVTVILYRLLIRFSLHPVCTIKGTIPPCPFFAKSRLSDSGLSMVSKWDTSATLFSYLNVLINDPPKWLNNPITGDSASFKLEPWWKISDFDDSVGDIKLIWEQSRMNWVVAFAQRVRNGDEGSLKRLNFWLSDWVESNPPYLGPNWKCGQEASIRVIHLCCAALILGQDRGSLIGLQELIRLHLQRIAPTIHYAVAQNNNHGTSEAAALFIGGSWLTALGALDGERYERLGRKWLEDRASKLIEKDGSFSQYSLNYHRMVLDTFSIVEVWLRSLNLQNLSLDFYNSAAQATSWLFQMVSPVSGDGPNLGANDGSLILQLTDSSYRDYRPSVQLASALFRGCRAYSNTGLWDLHLAWLGIANYESNPTQYLNCDYDFGGYKILRSADASVIFRYPKFRYRPSQADAMHVDLWVNGVNFLSDAGSYSYNSIPDMSGYFNGTASHNTVQFDDRDQMPKLGRFLFGSWLKSKYVPPISASDAGVSCSASYRDFRGAEHLRQVNVSETTLNVSDHVKGFKRKAVIRWRLPDSDWVLENTQNGVQVSNGVNVLTVKSDVACIRAEIVEGWKSLFYMQKKPVSVLEVEIRESGSFNTRFNW
ncbi:heparinase II/III-family protein [Alphaproteobacteria bacterium]|nr:heparinase II/III-family protein [Alphaproteobacteria bacterium]